MAATRTLDCLVRLCWLLTLDRNQGVATVTAKRAVRKLFTAAIGTDDSASLVTRTPTEQPLDPVRLTQGEPTTIVCEFRRTPFEELVEGVAISAAIIQRATRRDKTREHVFLSGLWISTHVAHDSS